ncbi:CDP-alcohol phosphatidyltransferase family protein [Roseicyclus persicicus]|uniref:CDP-alcohol phosphatidyltransferase family protein n=1 Tax=Roseicyclus persicicus TaxID=2650661 RepID=A0A7X6GZC8_9RHOB|nr:CDP-alcohol phosphatidyltransferase family protein [Roseibacterium persicicum]NKX44021.1 CDP-alcohol phosphatidyltransferase family protein [Roseibacterium persicicum]
MADFDRTPAAPHIPAPLPLRHGPVAGLGLAALAAAPAVAALAAALGGPSPAPVGVALAGHLAGAALAVAGMRRGYPHPDLGAANLVTLARLALTAALLAPLVAPASGWAVLAVALVALTLDGADGWLARRQGRVSAFGARFDMEVDAALGLILALNAWAAGTVGAAVLLLGLPRYVFVAAGAVWPWLLAPLPDRFGRKAACVVQIAALIALQAPVVQGPVAVAILAGGAAVLGWSFGRDVLWLWRTRS